LDSEILSKVSGVPAFIPLKRGKGPKLLADGDTNYATALKLRGLDHPLTK
jgi:hypothetical protein